MFFTDSSMWKLISTFALNLGTSEDLITKAKQDFDTLLDRYTETRRFVSSKYTPKKINNSLSMQNFYPWLENLLCFFELLFTGFRHAALRELRFYLESSARSYFIDSKHHDKNYEDKLLSLKDLRGKWFINLVWNLSKEKKNEINDFYHKLCDYVHLSEQSQTDALKDFGLNLSLGHPEYERDRELLEKTFDYANYLLLKSLEE